MGTRVHMSRYDPPARYLIKQWSLISGIIGPGKLLAYALPSLMTRMLPSISTRVSNESGDMRYDQWKFPCSMSLWQHYKGVCYLVIIISCDSRSFLVTVSQNLKISMHEDLDEITCIDI